METVAQGVNWHSASAFLKQRTTFAAKPPARGVVWGGNDGSYF